MNLTPLSADERARRIALIEGFLKEGYTPLRILGGRGSATEQADKADGKASGTYARWVRDEERRQRQGREFSLPDWSLYSGLLPHVCIHANLPAVIEQENKSARADSLRSEILSLISSSLYPVINPEAIVVEATTTRRYDKVTGEYKDQVTTPRTWMSETLRVAPVEDARNRKFIFTAAQNDGQLHAPFWNNLKAYAGHLGAEILVGPLTYQTSWFAEDDPIARSYPADIMPHICFGQFAVGDNFVFCGEMNTLVTASQPITDLVTYPRNRWAVFPHPKRQLKSVVSTDPDRQAHQVMTTGCVTVPKIIPRKAGIKSLFHSVIGAVIVEFDHEGDIFCRQLTANEAGDFYDLDNFISDGVVNSRQAVTAVVFGDIHLRKLHADNAMASFGFDMNGGATTYRNSILDTLNPKSIVLHDIFDNESRNHHHGGDNAYSFEMAMRGRDCVEAEVNDVGDFLRKLNTPGRDVIVVESNHDIGLTRWVKEGRYRNDGKNIRFGLQLEDAYLAHREIVGACLDEGLRPPSFSLLEYAIRLKEGTAIDGTRWTYDGGSCLIDNIEVGHHGFRGANGSKGTIAGFARMGRKLTIADKHSPEIAEGCYVAGCMNLKQGYNIGPSSWAVAHVVHYPDGNRAILTLQRGKWRAEKPILRIRSSS